MLHGGPENHTSYSSKSIYAYFYAHNTSKSYFRQLSAGTVSTFLSPIGYRKFEIAMLFVFTRSLSAVLCAHNSQKYKLFFGADT